MPILEDDDMIHVAVYWACLGYDDKGDPSLDEPVSIQLNCRIKRRSIPTTDGNSMSLDAQASLYFLPPLDSELWVAPDPSSDALEQWYASGSAGQTDEVLRVVSQGRVDDVKGVEVRYTAGLVWSQDRGVGGH